MKHYEITYYLKNQSRLFSKPQTVIAKSSMEKTEIINKCEECGYIIEMVRAFDPIEPEERFYA